MYGTVRYRHILYKFFKIKMYILYHKTYQYGTGPVRYSGIILWIPRYVWYGTLYYSILLYTTLYYSILWITTICNCMNIHICGTYHTYVQNINDTNYCTGTGTWYSLESTVLWKDTIVPAYDNFWSPVWQRKFTLAGEKILKHSYVSMYIYCTHV